MVRRPPFPFIFVLLALTSCQSWREPNPDSSFFRPPSGSTLELLQPVTIPADKAAVYIQDGALERDAQINHYRPFCKFELRTVASTARLIEPDVFSIDRTRQDTPVAQARTPFIAVSHDEGGMKYFIYATILDLHSARQPDVFLLTCSQWEYPPFMRHLTINEIRQALGGLFRLKLPGE